MKQNGDTGLEEHGGNGGGWKDKWKQTREDENGEKKLGQKWVGDQHLPVDYPRLLSASKTT